MKSRKEILIFQNVILKLMIQQTCVKIAHVLRGSSVFDKFHLKFIFKKS